MRRSQLQWLHSHTALHRVRLVAVTQLRVVTPGSVQDGDAEQVRILQLVTSAANSLSTGGHWRCANQACCSQSVGVCDVTGAPASKRLQTVFNSRRLSHTLCLPQLCFQLPAASCRSSSMA